MSPAVTGSQITIGAATQQDVPALVSLLHDLFTIEQDFHPDAAKQERGLRMLIGDTGGSVVMVARESGHAVGMATGQMSISTAQGSPSVWIEDVIVAKSHRARGIGKMLLDAIAQWAKQRQATRLQLLVDIDNTPAIGFYQRLGWKPTHLKAMQKHL